MGEGKKAIIVISVIAAIVVFLILISAGIVTIALLVSSNSDESSDPDRKVVNDFMKGYEDKNFDKISDLLMDGDGNFYSDTDPNSLEEFRGYFEESDFDLMEWEIEKVEQTEWKAENTGPIIIYTITIKIRDTETDEIDSNTDGIMVAQNMNNNKWGLSLDGFEFALLADDFEPDNTHETATEITFGKSEGHSIHVNEDEDWFVFTLESKENITITTYGEYSGDTEMYLYDDPEDLYNELDYNDDRGDDTFSEIDIELEAGTYYVTIISYDSEETVIDYTLELKTA